MRRYWGTIALSAIATLLGLYFVFIETPRQHARLNQQEQEGRVLSLTGDQVTKLEIEGAAGHLVLDRGDGGAWRMSVPISAEADEGTVRRLLSQLTSLSVVRAIDEVGDRSALGLDPPSVRVTAFRADGRAEVAFGNDSPTGSGVYVQRDDGKVFLTATTAKSTFEVSPDEVRRKEFVDFRPEAVTDIVLTHPGHTVRLHREGAEWRIAEPSRTADPDTVSSLLSRLRALRATGFADTSAERDALRLTAKPMTGIEITAGDDRVRVAFLKAADGALYARASGETLYRLDESVVKALPLDVSALRDLRVVRATSDDVRAVDVERGQERYRVTRGDSGWELEGRALEEDAVREVDAMIRTLTTLRGESVAAETAAQLPPKTFSVPAVRVGLWGADNREIATVIFSEASSGRRYALSESSGPVFWIAPATVDRIPSKSVLEAHLSPTS